jgi:probable ATP-dependent RNA helicase DDX4
MFSATFPEDIQRLAGKFLHNYVFLAVGIVGGACSDVKQHFHLVRKYDKRPKLMDLISQEGWLYNLHLTVLIKMVFRFCYQYVIFTGGEKTLVFVETKRTADFLASYLSENEFPTTSIHGERLQREREVALCDFKTGRMSVLVATAVAARGLGNANTQFVSCQSRAALDAHALCRKSIFADNKIGIIRTTEYYKV